MLFPTGHKVAVHLLRGRDDVLGETTGVAEAAHDVQGVTLRWSLEDVGAA